MHLKELSDRSGVSVASIKYYQREGLLPPGQRRHPTLVDYGPPQVTRLRLIATLRTAGGLGIADIRRLTDAIDDAVPLLELLETTQSVVLGADGSGRQEHPLTAGVLAAAGWPDASSAAREAFNAQLFRMEELGIRIEPSMLTKYAQIAALVADWDLGHLEPAGSRDELVMTVAVSTAQYGQLLLRLLGLAHASLSIRRYSAESGDGAPAPLPPTSGANAPAPPKP